MERQCHQQGDSGDDKSLHGVSAPAECASATRRGHREYHQCDADADDAIDERAAEPLDLPSPAPSPLIVPPGLSGREIGLADRAAIERLRATTPTYQRTDRA